jgi:hypothetical protein
MDISDVVVLFFALEEKDEGASNTIKNIKY